MDRLAKSGEIAEDRLIPGENPVPVYRFTGQPDVLLTLGQVGCPACAGIRYDLVMLCRRLVGLI